MTDGQKIKQWREQIGIPIHDFSVFVGIDLESLKNIESGKYPAPPQLMKQIEVLDFNYKNAI